MGQRETTGQGQYETPPESDATLRLCVLSSKILKVAGVILMDASGLSFGRDRPLSGQGKRVRMVEMEISRFHGSIYLNRQQVMPEIMDAGGTYSHFDAAGEVILSGSTSEKKEVNDDTSEQNQGQDQDPEAEDGEIPDSPPGAGARELKDREQGEMSDDQGENDSNSKKDTSKEEEEEEEHHRQYREYQRQLEEYQQYCQSLAAPPVFVDTFQIIDCGSTHGTFLNGQRLSAAKTASQPFPLNHLDQLQLGSTVFEIHAHEEGRICGSCQVTDDNEIEVLDDKDRETGDGAQTTDGVSNKDSPKLVGDIRLSREQERIEEMNRLRKKWAGPDRDRKVAGKRAGGSGYQDGSGSSSTSSPSSSDYGATSGYVDRAAKRRQFNPDHSQPIRSGMPDYSSSTTPETVSGFHVPVAKTNKGHAMLSKMGWKAGTGLGATRQGVVEPVQLMVADKKAGLGSKTIQSQGAAAVSASRPPETQAEIARRKARERYAQLK
ncbi:Angiogenic factor with G patch and FHA domains 1 [Linnemannia exigua]|uniref:Angiogenic factor with G patch and FHA domains 1 n=1 Tax=Linnemannia exigua TaxID=604196 RepID=A0AAD4DBV9_9FUNG|nr:Angiogenic factor with G patch and FHA domains 1 [Linnemannia exigua]